MKTRYLDLNTWLRARYGTRVQKITIDAGFTCPNRDGTLSHDGCIYCNARGSGTGAHGQGISITDQLREGQQIIGRRYKARKFIAYFQAFTNTYGSLADLERMYSEALAVRGVVGLAIGTRPDCVDEPVLELLARLAQKAMIWLEFGLQSAHDETLQRINRGHDFACFKYAVAAAHGRGLLTCAHVILGLPGETKRHILETAERLAALDDLDGVKLHLLYVIKGTRLETLWRQGRYQCLDQEGYVEMVCDFLECLPPRMVIQRLTADPHPDELLAPLWAIDKNETRNKIQELLDARDTWQGKYHGSQE